MYTEVSLRTADPMRIQHDYTRQTTAMDDQLYIDGGLMD